jgi:hypothetical protein
VPTLDFQTQYALQALPKHFGITSEFIPIVAAAIRLKQDPLIGRRYHHQPSLHDLEATATTCHFYAIFLTTLINERKGGPIDYPFQEDPPLLILFQMGLEYINISR